MIKKLFSGLMMSLALTSPTHGASLPSPSQLLEQRFPTLRSEGTYPDEVRYFDSQGQILARVRFDGPDYGDSTLYDAGMKPMLALRARLTFDERYLYLDQHGKILCKVVVALGEGGGEVLYYDGSGRPISEAGLNAILRSYMDEIFPPASSRRDVRRQEIFRRLRMMSL